MKEVRDRKDLTIHDVQPVSDKGTNTSCTLPQLLAERTADELTNPPAAYGVTSGPPYVDHSLWPCLRNHTVDYDSFLQIDLPSRNHLWALCGVNLVTSPPPIWESRNVLSPPCRSVFAVNVL